MLFATQTEWMTITHGLDQGIDDLMDVGFPALDVSMFEGMCEYEHAIADDWKQTADRLRERAAARGVSFVQAHAPFGGGYEHYTQVLAPQMGRIFDFAGRIGVHTIVVHPIQRGRYYGHEEELYQMNMEFYHSLAPLARNAGVRIGIENMWQHHPVTGYIVDDVCADPKELCRYYDDLGAPDAFTVNLDLGHVALCGREPEDAIRTIGHDRLGSLHVHDVNYREDLHTLPGVAKLHWDAICDALADVHYDGVLTLEADDFLKGFEPDFRKTASRFMCERAAYLAEKIEKKKNA